jgi:hypothetical protein
MAIPEKTALFSVETIPPPGGYGGEGLHWFGIAFPDRRGRCLMTTRDAQHLRQLTTEWVRRALLNLADRRGWDWVVAQACSSPGLILRHTDAGDVIDEERPEPAALTESVSRPT